MAVVGHEPPRLVEPDPLEVLERRAGRHELEVMVEGPDDQVTKFRLAWVVFLVLKRIRQTFWRNRSFSFQVAGL